MKPSSASPGEYVTTTMRKGAVAGGFSTGPTLDGGPRHTDDDDDGAPRHRG